MLKKQDAVRTNLLVLFPIYSYPVLDLHRALSATATAGNRSKNQIYFYLMFISNLDWFSKLLVRSCLAA